MKDVEASLLWCAMMREEEFRFRICGSEGDSYSLPGGNVLSTVAGDCQQVCMVC